MDRCGFPSQPVTILEDGMGRRPLCPKHLVAVRLDHATEAFLAYVRSRVGPDSGTNTAKKVLMNALLDKLGAAREVWTITSGDLEDTLTWIIDGASPEEAEQRRQQGRKPRTGRT